MYSFWVINKYTFRVNNSHFGEITPVFVNNQNTKNFEERISEAIKQKAIPKPAVESTSSCLENKRKMNAAHLGSEFLIVRRKSAR